MFRVLQKSVFILLRVGNFTENGQQFYFFIENTLLYTKLIGKQTNKQTNNQTSFVLLIIY